jgi:hypothetical protein
VGGRPTASSWDLANLKKTAFIIYWENILLPLTAVIVSWWKCVMTGSHSWLTLMRIVFREKEEFF